MTEGIKDWPDSCGSCKNPERAEKVGRLSGVKRGGEGKADSWRDELFLALLARTGYVTPLVNTDKYERGHRGV